MDVDYLGGANWGDGTFNFYYALPDSFGVLYIDSLGWDIPELPVRSLTYQSVRAVFAVYTLQIRAREGPIEIDDNSTFITAYPDSSGMVSLSVSERTS